MKPNFVSFIAATVFVASVANAQIASPGLPEENGLAPKSETTYVNIPPAVNNASTESLGVSVAANGNVIIGWEDDGSGLNDNEAVWTLISPSGLSITPETTMNSKNPEFAGQTITSKFLSYFRADRSPIAGYTSWGPKIKANLFGDGIGMGATSFALGREVAELADLNMDAGGGGDFPAVQLLSNDGSPIGIVTGASDADAEPEGNIRIGDWDYLANGNIVVVGESRQESDLVDRFGGSTPNRHAVYRIVDSSGKEIKAFSAVSELSDARVEMWHGVGVTKNGFGIRFSYGGRATVRLFDNAGNPTTGNLDLGTITGKEIASGGGRGDGAGFHGNGNDAYVAVNSGTDENGARQVWVTVLNADGTVRYSKGAIDDWDLLGPDRVDAAIDASGKVIVVFGDASGAFGDFRVIMGRLLNAQGTPQGSTFYISEKENNFNGFAEARNPRIAWRNGFAAVVWESQNSLDTADRVVAFRLFGTFEPGSIESVGLKRIVADTPIIVPELNALGNWEPFASVIGTSTFLIEGNTFAEGSNNSAQRYVVALQPTDGSPMKLTDGFYDDSGKPFSGQINFSRQNGNPGRVAGDTRPGAMNYMVGGEASPHVLTEFNSDGRWDLGFDRLGDGRYATVQAFSLDPATLTPVPTSKAIDAINGRLTEGGGGGNQIGRFGGEIVALENGNFLVVVDDRSGSLDPATSTTAVIIAPDGSIVKESFLVETRDSWSNIAAFKGGFAIRVHENIHFFNLTGDLQGTINQNTSGESFDTGRGDGTRLAGHINSPYIYLAGKVANAPTVKVAAWDSRDRSFVAKADVSEPAFAGDFDRVNLAVDALNRVTVAWVSKPPGYEFEQVAARVLALDGASKKITALTPSFLAFVNSAKTGGIRSLGMSVATTTREILIAAKGEINLQNNPASGANSPREINFFTVISHPDPKDDPTPSVGGGGTPTGGRLISNIVESGGDNEATDTVTAKWTGVTFTNGVAGEYLDPFTVTAFGEDARMFVDRNHQWNGAATDKPLPSYLVGGEYILSGNDNRDNAQYKLDITVSAPSIVYMLVDNRLTDGLGDDPPEAGAPLSQWTGMAWMAQEGYTPVINGWNRTGDMTKPDEVGADEGGDGVGPGEGINQWSSVYSKIVPAGTFSIFQADNAGRNMYGVVIKPINITDVVETGGDNEATDTVTAKWTGVTFTNGVAGEYLDPFTVPAFGEDVRMFVDRNHQWNGATTEIGIPGYLLGSPYIMSGNDNRDNAAYRLDVTVRELSVVYMLIDDRLTDGNGENPPEDGKPLAEWTGMAWMAREGFNPVRNGLNRTGDSSVPDEVGADEGGDGVGPGEGINQWSSVYSKTVPAGTFSLFQADNAGRNMYGVVVKPAASVGVAAGPELAQPVLNGGNLTISWTGAGKLQEATDITGPWTDVAGNPAGSATVQTTGAHKFYRVVAP